MRNIGKLVALDWKRIFKSPLAFLLITALVVIPSLYCWFNVWALWDPLQQHAGFKSSRVLGRSTRHFSQPESGSRR